MGEHKQRIPLQAANAEQLPREQGWTYDEIAKIVGSLYLDSRHSIQLREEQFQAVVAEYQQKLADLNTQVRSLEGNVQNLTKENNALRQELDIRNLTDENDELDSTASDDGEDLV